MTSLEVASAYLLDFFVADGRSVLIRGDPGTGKTSLVLNLLEFHSKNDFKSIYMSTRLSAKTLKSHQPWIEVVQGKYGTVPRLDADQIGFQDSRRMDGVRAISGLRQYLEQIQNPFVVLDSWEGLFFESHPLGVEEISKLVEDYEARFVVVTERREQTDLDYLLDGVVVLRRKFHDEKIVREIELKKLRGVSIQQSRFLFTLDQGRFRYLPPFGFADYTKDLESVGQPISIVKKDAFSTGSQGLDSILGGGLSAGSLNLLQLGNDVPSEVRNLILRTIFSNFANNGHSIVYVPFMGSPRGELESMLPNLAKKTIERSIAMLTYDSKEKSGPHLKGDLLPDFEQINATIENRRTESGKPVLVVVSLDALEALYGTEPIVRELSRSISMNKSTGNVMLQIASPNASTLSVLRALCDTELRLETLHGTPVLSSAKPASVLH